MHIVPYVGYDLLVLRDACLPPDPKHLTARSRTDNIRGLDVSLLEPVTVDDPQVMHAHFEIELDNRRRVSALSARHQCVVADVDNESLEGPRGVVEARRVAFLDVVEARGRERAGDLGAEVGYSEGVLICFSHPSFEGPRAFATQTRLGLAEVAQETLDDRSYLVDVEELVDCHWTGVEGLLRLLLGLRDRLLHRLNI